VVAERALKQMNVPENFVNFVVVGAVGLVLSVVGVATFYSSVTAEMSEMCIDADTRERARILMFEGIDQALKAHAAHVFAVWMKDASDQPRRASVGMRNGLKAYAGSRAAVQKWNPPACAIKIE
jgi:hypothetical protein